MNSADYAEAIATVGEAQAYALELLDVVLRSHMDAGINATALGVSAEFASDPDSIAGLVGVQIGRGVEAVTAARWPDTDGGWHDLTAPTGNSFGARLAAALIDYVQDCRNNARDLADDIAAAATIDDVLAIDLSAGWPSRSVADPSAGIALANDVGAFIAGKPSASEVILRFVAARPFVLPSALSGSRGDADIAATAQTDFDVTKNGSSVGTVRFAAAGTAASFIAASAASFAAGDVLAVVAPSSADATLADISITLRGVRG